MGPRDCEAWPKEEGGHSHHESGSKVLAGGDGETQGPACCFGVSTQNALYHKRTFAHAFEINNLMPPHNLPRGERPLVSEEDGNLPNVKHFIEATDKWIEEIQKWLSR